VPVAETNGITTFYEDTGDGPAVVLVHGHSLDLRMWKYQLAPLVDMGYRVIRYDVRGHGRSTVPTSEYTWDNYSQDLADLLGAVNVTEGAHVVGLSMGGAIALKFTLDHPGQVASLTLVDSALPGFTYSGEFSSEIIALRDAVRAEGAGPAFERLWLPHPLFDGLRPHPDKFAEATEMVAGFQAAEYLEEAETPDYVQPDLAAQLGEVAVPTLVVVGEDDVPDFKLIAEIMGSTIPGARMEIMPGRGHTPPMEDPASFNRILMQFLASVGSVAKGAR
jgi:pimeloyl-ACP methyl ester carboxylesterase